MTAPRLGVVILTLLTIGGAVASAAVLAEGFRTSQGASSALPSVVLPEGCTRTPGGFLIIASEYGYNDSVLEGAGPSKLWPVITVDQGQEVTITVCNVDNTQSHGFQIANYLNRPIESIAPGKVLTISFIADKAGDFAIFCEIFCSIHLFMEYGLLRVLS